MSSAYLLLHYSPALAFSTHLNGRGQSVFEPIPPSASGFSCNMTGTGSKRFLELRGSLLLIVIRHDLPSVAASRV